MNNTELANYIDEYGKYKQEEKRIKANLDHYNKLIKTKMGEDNLDEFEGTDYIASYTLRKQESLDLDGVLSILLNYCEDTARDLGIIKTKDYIDTDALEKAIYKNELDKDVLIEMNTCKQIKRTPTLTIKEIKKGE